MIRSTNGELSAVDWKVQELNECEIRFRKDLEVDPRQGGSRLVLFQKKACLEADSTGLRDRRNIMSQIVLTSTRID